MATNRGRNISWKMHTKLCTNICCVRRFLYLLVAVMSLWGALSDERSGLSPVSHCHHCLVHCQIFNIIYIVHVTCFEYMQYILDLCQSTLSTTAIYHNFRYNSNLPQFPLQQQSSWPPPSLSLLCFRCRASPWPIWRTFAFSWFRITDFVAVYICTTDK
jgi:hypothetical protein